MKRKNFLFTFVLGLPGLAFGKLKSQLLMRTTTGFKVNSGEARFGKHYKMKGVTLNTLDIKISGKDTDNDLAVFEQSGGVEMGTEVRLSGCAYRFRVD